jgi:plasmid maintenance system antidote protein VapI
VNQIALPVEIRTGDVAHKRSLGAAMELCAERAGFAFDKELQQRLGVDKAQFSRWMSGQEGIHWAKFSQLMDICGNDAPLFWMLHQRGYDLHSVRKLESETEQQNRLLREEITALRRVLSAGSGK